jgi:DnaK suppressor protein
MHSTSVLPATRRFPAPRVRGGSQPRTPAHQGPGGLVRRRAQLEERWRSRLDRVTMLSLAYHDETDSARTGRAAETGAGSGRARQLARQVVAERQALAEIEAALDRIAAGQYGWCEQCGRAVAAAVLAVQPEARFCAACGRAAAGLARPGHRSQPRHSVVCA